MSKIDNNNEEENWFIYVNQQTRGPMGLRDLDVLLRTNQINSRTFCWKNGMKEWKPLIQVEQIKQSILESSNQFLQIGKINIHLEQNINTTKIKSETQLQQGEQEEDHMIENKDQNPLTILQVTVDNLLKKSFHQSADGKWSIYDEQKQEWVLQDEQPIQKINQMKNLLLTKLKSQFFTDQKYRRKFKEPAHPQNQPQRPLTKEELQRKERNKKKTKRAAQKKKQKWYQAKINTFVYVSGLPFDVNEDELKQFVSKAGVLRIDLTTGKQKIKIYRDQNGLPKGDAAVSYARQQSVDIAIQMLNEKQIRDGFKVTVQRAQFNQKDQQYKPRQTKKQNKVKKILAKKNQQKMFGWEEQNDEKGEGFRIIIMKHVFTPQQANNQSDFADIKSDIVYELGKIGQIKRIRFFDTHPDGIVEIKFAQDATAQKCIQIMNGRFFDGRQIICEYWDGQTDYKLDAHSIALQQERLMQYANNLQKPDGNLSNNLPVIKQSHEQDAPLQQ